MERAETGTPPAVALEFPGGDATSPVDSSPSKVPRRLRQRLAEGRSPPTSAEEIEAKLRDADLRRQKFHEWLSSKARPKVRSPSWSSQEEDLGRRLDAKLCAAEQKRLSLLQRAQMRLARLDELRQAAKTDAALRSEREREELGMKMNSRIQQAEANRRLILQAHLQRRAAAQERKSQSLMKRTHREKKYKECIQKAIFQKRIAAERKRLGILEAERTRAHAKALRAHRVAVSVYQKRESDRRKMREQLEARLLRAKKQRAEYLKQRGNPNCSSSIAMRKNGEYLSRKLARCWRQFVRSKKTTCALAKAYESLGINMELAKLMPFEQLAVRIGSSATLGAVKSLLDRFESRILLAHSSSSSALENIDHLLRRVASPTKKSSASRSIRSRAQQKREPSKVSRYAVRVVLCAFMILGHPDAVFSERGEREIELVDKAVAFLREFELLISIALNGPQTSTLTPAGLSFRSQLEAFDSVWRAYLYSFVVWKVKDARLLEEDLVRAACQLELSMMHKCKMTTHERENADLNPDLRAIQDQVAEDQQLLREKVKHLSGSAGVDRMESAISETRLKYFEGKENGSSSTTPISRISSLSAPAKESSDTSSVFLNSMEKQYRVDLSTKSTRAVRSLFREEISQPSPEMKLLEENEILVNEMLHSSVVGSNVNRKEDIKIKERVKETMEKAFWDGVTESLMKEQPEYETLIGLVKEVREDICGMSPKSWKDEIHASIDLDILSQAVDERVNDLSYLGVVMEYALGILVKLSAPAKEEEMKKTHGKFLAELADIATLSTDKRSASVTTVVRGLRFVLEQIRALKEEVSRARIEMMEPVIRGPAGIEYLQKAFAKRYGPPSDAATALPLTARWISSCAEYSALEWDQHAALISPAQPQALPPATAIRSGGRVPGLSFRSSPPSLPSSSSSSVSRHAPPECKGDKVDVLLRLGLLKLACTIEGLTRETTPETFQFNWRRLRDAQAPIQNTIVICTSLLVLRQVLISLTPWAPPAAAELEAAVSLAAEKLSELVERNPDVGLPEIVAALTAPPEPENLRQNGELMARMLSKSLQAGDPVFVKVSGAVHVAARTLVLSGGGGAAQAAAALQRVGGAALLGRLTATAESIATMAVVSGKVHGPWYAAMVNAAR